MMDHLLNDIIDELANETNQFRKARLEKLKTLVEKDINPYPSRFDATHSLGSIHEQYSDLKAGQETTDQVRVCGRIRSLRNSGMFIDIHDPYDKLQLFCHNNHLSSHSQDLLSNLDLGDFIGVTGHIRRTPRNEITVNVVDIYILTKTLLPLPEKYHGLQDTETRMRQRYLDLLATPETRHILRSRSEIVAAMRHQLIEWKFLEVETPMLHVITGGAAARPFVTHHNTMDMDLFLRIAPELYLKRLMVGGLSDRLFEINRNFRNEGLSTRHNPEFTMIELYQAYADYTDMMTLTENLVESIALKVFGTTEFQFGDHTLSMKAPWPRVSMIESVFKATNIDFRDLNQDTARKTCEKLGFDTPETLSWGQALEWVFGEKVEPTLIQPTHITDLPVDISPLAKKHTLDQRLTERFESFVCGMELANGFSELSDPIDQRKRFEAQMIAKEQGDHEAHMMDADYITALNYGLPPTGGLGIGVDRLVMLLTNASSIREVIAFPTVKPRD